MTDRDDVERWVGRYEAAWRSPDPRTLAEVFTVGATYLHSPYAEPIVGLEAIAAMWDAERDGPDEVFTLETGIVAVDGDTAVVRAVVRYGQPVHQEYTDLWVIALDGDGRCHAFEEWPFWPGQPWSARVTP
ncbi:MAG TPA: nuclear transport factor 2 family protein [Acidimicrobiales bacterium]|nr:nuclear transport factor 2 family protein [Acidimicrobiales bacterium]